MEQCLTRLLRCRLERFFGYRCRWRAFTLDARPDAASHSRRGDPVVQKLYLGTLGGANALGLDGEIGNFEAGKDADFIVVEGTRCRKLHSREVCSGGDYRRPTVQ